jgi:hypothetical protein
MTEHKHVNIVETTDGKFIGQDVQTDFIELILPTGETVQLEGRIHLGNGTWKVWNSNYILVLQEITTEGV